MTRYLPIAEHGLIGDLSTVALVGTDGTIDWYCCPRFDSPSVFAAILDRQRGGRYRIAPALGLGTVKQLYFPDTNVLITRFLTPSGVGEVQDFMPIGPRQRLIRRVLCVRGEMTFRIEVEPRFDYGREEHEAVVHEHGAVFRAPSLTLALTSGIGLQVEGGDISAQFRLEPGETETFALETVPDSYVPRSFTADEMRQDFEDTVTFWRKWLARSNYRGRWREMVHRSALVLKLLTYEPSGAMVAAATTSLPEELGGVRNWDYRYTWIRDSTFALWALYTLGFDWEASDYFWFIADLAERDEELQIVYGVNGERDLDEQILDNLSGYEGSRPVRIRNDAYKQRQHDVWGVVLDSFYLHMRSRDRLDARLWPIAKRLVESAL